MVMFRRFSPPFNPDILLKCSDFGGQRNWEMKGSPGNPGFGQLQEFKSLTCKTGQGSAARRHCPAVERVGGFNKLTNSKAYWVFKQLQRL